MYSVRIEVDVTMRGPLPLAVRPVDPIQIKLSEKFTLLHRLTTWNRDGIIFTSKAKVENESERKRGKNRL